MDSFLVLVLVWKLQKCVIQSNINYHGKERVKSGRGAKGIWGEVFIEMVLDVDYIGIKFE